MIKFVINKTGEEKQAYSLEFEEDRAVVKFSKDGKAYYYHKDNIRVVEDMITQPDIPFKIYAYERLCYNCNKYTTMLTYIILSDSERSLTFPWDKEALLERQDILKHIADPSIEYYGLRVLGKYKKFDDIMIKLFPDRIAYRYSKTTDSIYAMNLCEHCCAKQGENFLYRHINYFIKKMIELPEITI